MTRPVADFCRSCLSTPKLADASDPNREKCDGFSFSAIACTESAWIESLPWRASQIIT